MKGWLPLTFGLLGIVVGAVWTLQGLGRLGGSAMTGERIWAIIGPIVALVGVYLVVLGLRHRRGPRPPA